MSAERIVLTPEQYWEAVERARVLSRVVEEDPSDIDARLGLALLRRAGLDVEDPAWVLGFTPPDRVVDVVDTDADTSPYRRVDAWADRALAEALGYAGVGLLDRAIELLETVLRLQPDNDVARARLFELEMQRLGAAAGASADDTLRIKAR